MKIFEGCAKSVSQGVGKTTIQQNGNQLRITQKSPTDCHCGRCFSG